MQVVVLIYTYYTEIPAFFAKNLLLCIRHTALDFHHTGGYIAVQSIASFVN